MLHLHDILPLLQSNLHQFRQQYCIFAYGIHLYLQYHIFLPYTTIISNYITNIFHYDDGSRFTAVDSPIRDFGIGSTVLV